MKEFLHHLFIPRESNNQRSKILHHQSLAILILILLVGQFFLGIFKENFSYVLGEATDLSIDRLLELTNQKRSEDGKSTLTLSTELSKAAEQKAQDMFSKNYWAHYAPDGTSPWFFIKNSGYEYVYAGENLARGFTTSNEVVDAWIASPTHRDNMFSGNYNEIGFAVATGTLNGEDTVLVVQMFGSRSSPQVAVQKEEIVPTPVVTIPVVTTIPQVEIAKQPEPVSNPEVFSKSDNTILIKDIKSQPFIEAGALSKNTSIILLSTLLFALIIDMVIVERKKIIRLVGHNTDHLLFLGTILLFVLFVSKGAIL